MKSFKTIVLASTLSSALPLAGCSQHTENSAIGTLSDPCTGDTVGVVLDDGSFEFDNGVVVPYESIGENPDLSANACWSDAIEDTGGQDRVMSYDRVAVSGGCVTMQTAKCAAQCCVWCTNIHGCTSQCESTC